MFPFSKLPTAGRGRRHRKSTDGFEHLEHRRMLSASTTGFPFGPGGRPLDTIAFSLAPAAVQTGLTTLATTDGLTDPAATDKVQLGNRDGVETYSVTISSTGTVSRLTVDAAGNPATAPTQTTTTFGALASAPAAEITAIATAKSLTAPTSTTVVNVTTTAAGAVTYSVALTGDDTATPVTSTTATAWGGPFARGFAVMVDSAGNPVGNQQLPFSVFSTTIQSALNAGAPSGATALAATSTQTVDVRTSDGITTYSTQFTVSGTDTTVTVNAAGAAVTAASTATANFSAIPAAAQTELQALATAEGYTGTIATTTSVTVYTETGGTATLYAVTLSVTDTTTTSSTATHDETFVVDAAGNPTTTAMGEGFGGPGRGGPGGPGGGGDHGGGPGGGGHQGPPPGASDDGGSSSGSTTGTVTSAKATGTAVSTAFSSSAVATALSSASPTTPTLGTAISLFASALTNTTVLADLVQLQSDASTLKTDIKGLSKTDAATLKADEKGIATAIKAMSSTLAPGKKTLKADAAKYSALLRADQKAIKKAGSDATALSTAQAKLATDKAAAFAALSADLDALKSLIDADAGVTAAEAKLSTDLPTVATAQTAVESDVSQLETDVGAALSA